MKERYSVGWTDARSLWGTQAGQGSKRYGAEYTEDTSVNYAKSLAASMMATKDILMATILQKQRKRYEGYELKADAYEYKTEAKDLPIEACVSFWLIKFGDAPVPAIDTVEQDDLTWEIGNRLFWAGKLEHNIPNDTYTCK